MASGFDEFSKALAQQRTRRGVLRIVAGAAAGAALAWLGWPETAEQATLVEQANPCPPSLRQQCRQLRHQREQAFDLLSRSQSELKRLQDEQKKIQTKIDNLKNFLSSTPPSDPHYKLYQFELAAAQAELATNQGRQTVTQGVIDATQAQLKALDDQYTKLNCACCVEDALGALLGMADYAGSVGAVSQVPQSCCPSGQTPCGRVCCTSSQCCQHGTCLSPSQQSANACGTGGATCTPCVEGHTCENGACVCTTASCPNGCCTGGSCVPYDLQSGAICGTGGATCQACAEGQDCQNGVCFCGATACVDGCCSSGVCIPYSGQSSSFCGKGGATCSPCGPNQECQSGVCTAVCTATTCANGCCNGTTCVPYASQTSSLCGTGGATCAPCTSGTCQNGACTGGACNPYYSGYDGANPPCDVIHCCINGSSYQTSPEEPGFCCDGTCCGGLAGKPSVPVFCCVNQACQYNGTTAICVPTPH